MEIVTKIAPIILALIMLGLGLGLRFEDFTRVLKSPKDFFVGFFSQLIILPLVAYLLIIILRTPPEIAIGVMIIAAAPGGVTSNILTKFANGDVALSISLTAVISLISIITVPVIIFTSATLLGITEISQNISMTAIALKMFLVVTLPVLLGILIRRFATNFITSKTKIIQRISVILFLIVFLAIWIEEWDNVINYLASAGLITLVLNIIMMFVGYYMAKLLASGIEQRKSISLECGLQNGTLAVFVATQIFDEMIYLVPTAAYALIMFVTSLIFVAIVRKIS